MSGVPCSAVARFTVKGRSDEKRRERIAIGEYSIFISCPVISFLIGIRA